MRASRGGGSDRADEVVSMERRETLDLRAVDEALELAGIPTDILKRKGAA